VTLDELAAAPPARLPFPVTRALAAPVEARSDGDEMPTMIGHFSTFNDWYEVDSLFEGHFLERIGPRAFDKTISESRDQMKVLYDHGQDPQIGNKVLGSIEELRTDKIGPAYTVRLFDTSYNRDLAPGLKAGAYGSSFRFTVEKDQWDQSPERSDANPEALPERTITEARVYEFGPVTFPANPNATAGVRSTTDTFYQRSRDPEAFETLLRSAQAARTPKTGAATTSSEPPPGTPEVTPPEPPRSDTPRTSDHPITPKENRSVETEYITRDDKAARVVELEAGIRSRAVEYPGVFPPDIQATDDAENAEHDELVRDIAAWDQRQARLASFAADPKHVEPPVAAPAFARKQSIEDIHDLGKIRSETRSRDEYDTRVRENALRSIDSARVPRGSKLDGLVDIIERYDEGEDDKGEIARRVLLTGSPVYKRAFNKYLKGQTALWTQEEARAAALAVTGTTTTGGYAVPYVFDPTMLHIGAWTAENPFRAACRTVTITNGNNWRTVTVGAITAAYGTEASAATEGGPTFGQPTYTVQTAKAFVTVSVETMEDRPDLSGELTSVFAEGKDTLEENQFAIGVGTTVYPQGMFVDTAYTNQDTATNDVTALVDFATVEGALPLRYRKKAAWFMARSTMRQLQTLDTTYRYFSGAGIQYPGPIQSTTGPQPGSASGGNTGLFLLGYPIWEVPSAVSTLTTDGAIIAVLCDPSSYVIVDRIGMNVEVIPQMLNGATPSFPTLQRGIICYWRNTAKPINADAGRSLSVQ
jgi:HK97 family phage major capsid protein/HK97 family phage prohead protease